jgi:hypothetical protein
MERKKPKHLFSLIYMGITLVALVLIGVFATDLKKIAEALENFNLWWLMACLGAMLLFWFTDALLLHDITKYMYKAQPLSQSVRIALIGQYYSALTPSASGGQPAQVMYMKRRNVPVGTATCIVSIKFVVYELSLCAIFTAGIIMRGSYFYVHSNEAFWLTLLGFAFNLIAVSCIILTITNKKLVLGIGKGILKLLARMKIIRQLEDKLDTFERTIDDYHTAASYISKYKLRAMGSLLISVVNLSVLYVIPYLIYLSFGYTEHNIFDMLVMGAFISLAVSYFPLPGAAGASEGGFLLFFGRFFITTGATAVAMLIWRFLTYYLTLIVGSLLVLFGEVVSIRRKRRKARVESGEL